MRQVCRVSVKLLFVRHHEFCPICWLLFEIKDCWVTVKHIKMLSSFPNFIPYFSSCLSFPYLRRIKCWTWPQNSTPITFFDTIMLFPGERECPHHSKILHVLGSLPQPVGSYSSVYF